MPPIFPPQPGMISPDNVPVAMAPQQQAFAAEAPQFAPQPQMQQPGGGLLEMLTAAAGLGLNIAGAATGKGAAGESTLAASQQIGTRARQQEYDKANIEGQKSQNAADKKEAESMWKLGPRIADPEVRQLYFTDLFNLRVDKARLRYNDYETDLRAAKHVKDAQDNDNSKYIKFARDEYQRTLSPNVMAEMAIGEALIPTLDEKQIGKEKYLASQIETFLEKRPELKANLTADSRKSFVKRVKEAFAAQDTNSWYQSGVAYPPDVREKAKNTYLSAIPQDERDRHTKTLSKISELDKVYEGMLKVDPKVRAQVEGVQKAPPKTATGPNGEKLQLVGGKWVPAK